MEITITENEAGQRIDRFLRKRCRAMPEITLSDIYTRLRKWACRVNGKKVPENYRLQEGDVLTRRDQGTQTSLPDTVKPKSEKLRSYQLSRIKPLILDEDQHRIVWNKPAGIVTHPGAHHTSDMSLHDIMQAYLQQKQQQNTSQTFSPAFCFRLDKDTSGVIISAKTYDALQRLNQQIRERKVRKTYLAIVSGQTPTKLKMQWSLTKGYDSQFGVAKMYIEKGWKESLTIATRRDYLLHPTLGPLSLLEVDLHTGRMHQIRAHLTDAGFPLVGDLMYGNAAINRLAQKEKITRQLLHSWTYEFFDPFQKKQVSWTAPIPDDFRSLFADV